MSNQKSENRQTIMRLSRMLPLGFATILGLMVGIGIATKLSMNTLVETIDRVKHTYEVKVNLKALEKDLVDAETGERGFIITGREDFLEPFNRSTKIIKQDFEVLRNLVKDNPAQTQKLNTIETMSDERLAKLATNISLKRAGKEQEVRERVLSDQGKLMMDEIREQLSEMEVVENKLLETRQKAASQAEQLASFISFGGTGAAVAIGSLILWFISRKVVQPINEVANVIASSSMEIAAAVEQQERTATQQSISVNQTTTTMDELGVSSRSSAGQAESAAAGAHQVLTLVEGDSQQEYSSQSESSLKEKVGKIADQILGLSEQVSQIYSIASVVSDLASQTNMLALNAAVEAVRAGEHGKGFSVVASEIRKLADQSRNSAGRINALVGDIQNATNSTVLVTDEGTKTVANIVAAINDIALNSQQISLNAKQQAIAIQQVVEAMNSLKVSATETASGISQTRVGIQRLNEAALKLKAVM